MSFDRSQQGGNALPPPRSLVVRLFASALAVLWLSGCARNGDWEDSDRMARNELFGTQDERKHDFGVVIGRPGLKLSHTFPLVNTTQRTIRLLRAVNRKTCCGELNFTPTTLLPGQGAGLEVIFKVGEASSPLSHVAVVETDDPEYPTRSFLTFARPLPRFRVAPDDSRPRSVAPGGMARVNYVAYEYGTSQEPPSKLDAAVVSSDVKATWSGPPRDRILAESVIERSRPLLLELVASGAPGERYSTLRVSSGSEMLGAASLRWQVESAIQASPSALLIDRSSSGSARPVSLRLNGDRPFRVTGVTSALPGIEGRSLEDDTRATHVIKVSLGSDRSAAERWGELTVKTDHPGQPVVKVAVLIRG